MSIEFEPFPKIPRTCKDKVVITEKIDGTNGQIFIVTQEEIEELWADLEPFDNLTKYAMYCASSETWVLVGSRNRYIVPEEHIRGGKGSDNYGFAGWVWKNYYELVKLGPGRHYGEWYGSGIGPGYGLKEKRFALFNTQRWGAHNPNTPSCCDVVPVLYQGERYEGMIEDQMQKLKSGGSVLVPGWDRPEGIVTYSTATKSLLKTTFQHSRGKWDDTRSTK